MGEVRRGQRIVVEIEIEDDRIDPVSDAINRALEWAIARLEAHSAADRRCFRGEMILRPRLTAPVLAALAAPGAVTVEVEAEGLPPGWVEAALGRRS